MKNIFIHLGFVLILIGTSIICVDKVSVGINDYYSDVNKSQYIIDSVYSNYDDFKNKSLIVKDEIVDVSKSFNIYLEEFPEKNEEILNKINKVESSINDLSVTTNNLIDYCSYNLNNSAMDNKCSSFKTNFVNMIESYDKMINVYNDVVKAYNDYSIENGKDLVEEHNNRLNSSIVAASTSIEL